MFRTFGTFDTSGPAVRVSFREPGRWSSLPSSAATPLTTTAVVFGDELCGPVLLMLDLAPGVALPSSDAHGHASDSWRTSLKGTLPMGPDTYEPGDFRFQHGWKPYASDNLANGPDGGWTALLFGDRRGMRPRHVKHVGPAIAPVDVEWAEYLGIDGDLSSDDAGAAPPPSCFASTFDDQSRGARINGSFDDTTLWVPGPGGHVAGAAMGDAHAGPLVFLFRLEAGAAAPSFPVRSDVVRIVCSGDLQGPAATMLAGDVTVQGPGELSALRAGPSGACEMVVVGDRRGVSTDVNDGTWGSTLGEVIAFLRGRVQVRAA